MSVNCLTLCPLILYSSYSSLSYFLQKYNAHILRTRMQCQQTNTYIPDCASLSIGHLLDKQHLHPLAIPETLQVQNILYHQSVHDSLQTSLPILFPLTLVASLSSPLPVSNVILALLLAKTTLLTKELYDLRQKQFIFRQSGQVKKIVKSISVGGLSLISLVTPAVMVAMKNAQIRKEVMLREKIRRQIQA